jgi:pilus assembly protein CpaB
MNNNELFQQLRQNRSILLVGVACGLVGALLIYFYVQGKEKEFSDKVAVVSMAGDIKRNDMIMAKDLRKKTVPRKYVLTNAVPWKDHETLQGTKALVNLVEGQVVAWDFVEVTTLQRTFADKLDSTQRAITMSVDEFTGVAGNIVPGDRVDVMGIFNVPEASGRNRTVVKTLLQCVPVLSVGYRGTRLQQAYNSITLEVSPLEAELLFFAESQGTFKYVLRNRENIAIEDMEIIDFYNLQVVEQKTTETKKLRVRYADQKK